MASLNWLKLTRQHALALKKHNGQEERLTYNHSNPDIDKSKTDQNYCIGCDDYDDAVDEMLKRVKEVDERYPQKTKTERKDRKVALSIETKCPQAICDSGRSREFFEKTHQLLSNFFGAENNVGSFVHLDEMHLYIDKDGTEKMSLAHMTSLIAAYAEWEQGGNSRRGISASKLMNPTNLKKLNKEMCDMVRREFGIEYNTGEQARHATVEHLKAESKLAELNKAVEDRAEDLDLIKQAGDKAFAELSQNIDEAKRIGVQQLKEISEEIEEKQATLKNIDEQILAAVEIPPRPVEPTEPPPIPAPPMKYQVFSKEEEREYNESRKVYDRAIKQRDKDLKQYRQEHSQWEKDDAEWNNRYAPIAAAKKVMAKSTDKEHEVANRERQLQHQRQQMQEELERGRAEVEQGKLANQKRSREIDVEVGRRVQEQLARTDKFQRLMQTSVEFNKRLELLYKGADKRNKKTFEDKVKSVRQKGEIER